MSVNSSMTSIADKIREIQGTSGGLTLDTMSSNLGNIINNVDNQHSQIEQIKTLLNEKLPGKAAVGTVDVRPSSNARNITFTGLPAEPTSFIVIPTTNITLSSSTRYVTFVAGGNGPNILPVGGGFITTSTNTITGTGFSYTYRNGSLTINTTSTTDGGYFRSGITYQLIYTITPIFGLDSEAFCVWTSSSNTRSAQFGPFPGTISSFLITPNSHITLSNTNAITSLVFDGTSIKGTYSNRSTNTASSTTFNYSLSSDGTLTINSTNGYFLADTSYVFMSSAARR